MAKYGERKGRYKFSGYIWNSQKKKCNQSLANIPLTATEDQNSHFHQTFLLGQIPIFITQIIRGILAKFKITRLGYLKSLTLYFITLSEQYFNLDVVYNNLLNLNFPSAYQRCRHISCKTHTDLNLVCTVSISTETLLRNLIVSTGNYGLYLEMKCCMIGFPVNHPRK